tara:strand:- start:7358 stop:8278 length:921 start_codon:yes stop_codon:yes gene_type:complete
LKNKKKILITGGTGFIGFHLALFLTKKNWTVHSLSKSKPKNFRKIDKVKYIYCDIRKKNNLKKKLDDYYDYIVNLSGYVDHSKNSSIIKTHFNGCKNLASLFIHKKIQKFVQVGSSIEYGKLKSPQVENKKNSQLTNSVYGKAKLLSTKFLIGLYEKYSFPVTIIRLYLVYGPKQDINRVIPITIKNALENKKFDCSSGLQLRDFIFIDDVINAIIKILRNKKTNGEILNIGLNKPIRIKELIQKICNLVGAGRPIFGKILMRKDEIKSLYPNISKAHKILKWRPKVSLNTGLKRTIKYYKNAKFN